MSKSYGSGMESIEEQLQLKSRPDLVRDTSQSVYMAPSASGAIAEFIAQ